VTLDFFEKFRENLARFPERVAMESISGAGRESFTCRRIAAEAAGIGALLLDRGIRPGDPVGILMDVHPRWGIAFLAVQSAGAVAVPLDILHDHQTLARLIAHAGCRFLIVSSPLRAALEAVQGLLPARLPFLVADETPPAEVCVCLPLVPRNLDDPLMILYTSGTTGDPKGVVLTGRNVYRNVVEVLKMIGPTSEDHFLNVLPLYHVLALVINFIIPLYLGARVTFVRELEARQVVKAFREEGITVFVCVPQFYYLFQRRILQEVERQGPLKRFLFQRLLAVSRFANLRLGFNPGGLLFRAIHQQLGPRLRILGVGGARFDPEVAAFFRDLGFDVVQAFGMTETAALITVAPPKGHAVGTAGVPLPHVEVRIAEPGENGEGEVLVRGENVMRGYHNNPEATAEALRGGWLHTGDLGRIDQRGFLHITGRLKDVIVLSSGKNIYPEEIEKFYQSACPYIREICVVGVPDPAAGRGGERLHAVIVPDFELMKAAGVVSIQETIRWEWENASARLPGYKRVMSLEVRSNPLPLTTTRKVKRFQVRKEVLDRAPAPPAAPDAAPASPLEEKLFTAIRRVKDAPAIHRSMNLELDLGFTSLERVELWSAIQEAFGVRIPEQEAAGIQTVAELVEVAGRLGAGGEAPAEQPRVSWEEAFPPGPAAGVLRAAVAACIRLLCRLLFRLRVEGRSNLPEPPFLLCPNHASYLDPFAVAGALPRGILPKLFFLGDLMYFSGPVTSRLGRWARVIALSAGRGVPAAMRLAAEGLRRGLVLCVFPEGERSIDGTVKEFRPGAAMLASEQGVPAVPVGIRGTWEAWPRGSNRIRLRRVSVTFGPPLDASGKTAAAFNAELREAVVRLL
jgi:long-chain acyl-CoA synthetase